MRTAFVTLSPLAVVVVAVLGFALGWLWYSPFLFAKSWMREMNFKKEDFKIKPAQGALMLGGALVINLISTTALALMINEHHLAGVLPGIKMGLLYGVGFVAVRYLGHAIFEMKSLKLIVINVGYDVALFALQGAILGVWR